ncbi:MAG: response regulator [Pseudomonadota bacterium]|nr:response regulator [Pseudomonadota bacterium]
MATILVVDDDTPSRELLVMLLGYMGHRLLAAGDGAEGLERARAGRPELVISDILMPTMDGVEFVRRLRADPAIARTPVIFSTAAYRLREAQDLARGCGVAVVLPKPCDPEVVLNTVRQVLGLPGHPSPPPPPPPQDIRREPVELVSDKLTGHLSHLHELQEFAGTVDRGLGLAGERARLRRLTGELQESLAGLQAVSLQLAALLEITLALAAEREPLRLLETFCRGAQHLLSARYAGLGILDEDGRALRCFVTKGLDADAQARLGLPSPQAGVLGQVLADCRPCRLRDLPGDPQAVGLPPSHPPFHSFLALPVASAARTYGWV